MNLFTVGSDGKLAPYQEQDFSVKNKEIDLEILLENNADQFFLDHRILIIGRQVATSFSTYIDLLGVDEFGNAIVIELKRDKTPRETVAQLLEYASFIDCMDYKALENIFRDYNGSDIDLDDYHKEYFQSNDTAPISWNKKTKLLIIAQTITNEIMQVAVFLRKTGIDIACIEFKYFVTKSGEQIISSDYVIGKDGPIQIKAASSSLPKIDQHVFMADLDGKGKEIFEKTLQYVENNRLLIRWGSKGFSVNYQSENSFVGLFFCYPMSSVFKQSIYTGYEEIRKKITGADEIIALYEGKIKELGIFRKASSNYKCIIDEKLSIAKIDSFFAVVTTIIECIENNGIK